MSQHQRDKQAYMNATPMQREMVRRLLCDVLGCLRAQYLSYQTSHWQVVGQSFYGNHLLFQRLYESVQDQVDQLAEKLVGYLGREVVGLDHQIKHISTYTMRWSQIDCHHKRGLQSEADLQAALKRAYEGIKQVNAMTLGLDDWIMATANAHEENEYLLQQALTPVPGRQASKKASTNTERYFYKATDGKWYVENESYEEDWDTGEQIEGEMTHYGPFPSFKAAEKYMDRNFANSGSYTEDDSGRQRPPRNPVKPGRSRRLWGSGPRLAFNKYNPDDLLAALVDILEKYELDDAADEVKKITRVVQTAWRGRDRTASGRTLPPLTGLPEGSADAFKSLLESLTPEGLYDRDLKEWKAATKIQLDDFDDFLSMLKADRPGSLLLGNVLHGILKGSDRSPLDRVRFDDLSRDLKRFRARLGDPAMLQTLGLALEAIRRGYGKPARPSSRAASAPTAEGDFYDNPEKKEVLEFANTGAISNSPEVAAAAAEEDQLDVSEAKAVAEAEEAPPTPDEIKEEAGGSAVSTLNRFVVETEDPAAEPAVKMNELRERQARLQEAFANWPSVRTARIDKLVFKPGRGVVDWDHAKKTFSVDESDVEKILGELRGDIYLYSTPASKLYRFSLNPARSARYWKYDGPEGLSLLVWK